MLARSAAARRASLRTGHDQLVVLDLDTGADKARVDVPSPSQGFLFPAPGFARDVYYQSLTTIARVAGALSALLPLAVDQLSDQRAAASFCSHQATASPRVRSKGMTGSQPVARVSRSCAPRTSMTSWPRTRSGSTTCSTPTPATSPSRATISRIEGVQPEQTL